MAKVCWFGWWTAKSPISSRTASAHCHPHQVNCHGGLGGRSISYYTISYDMHGNMQRCLLFPGAQQAHKEGLRAQIWGWGRRGKVTKAWTPPSHDGKQPWLVINALIAENGPYGTIHIWPWIYEARWNLSNFCQIFAKSLSDAFSSPCIIHKAQINRCRKLIRQAFSCMFLEPTYKKRQKPCNLLAPACLELAWRLGWWPKC